MTTIARTNIDVGGKRISLLRGGPDREPMLLLHGGVPARTLYCSGAHMWDRYAALAARDRHVIAPDLPGFGDSDDDSEPYRVDRQAQFALALIESLKLGPCHIVGHDEGGAIAIAVALAAPAAVRSISIVASPTAAPAGDSIENLALANPPQPLWSRAAQSWALERLSHDPAHVDAALLDRCLACAGKPAHRQALARTESGEAARAFATGAAQAKTHFYTACRERAFPVPAQIVWGSGDPMTSIEHGRVLFGIIAERQPATQFHLINRTGNFPFREEPQAFHQIVGAFQDGLRDVSGASGHIRAEAGLKQA